MKLKHPYQTKESSTISGSYGEMMVVVDIKRD